MAARTTRREARARILAAFAAQLDRVSPADETIPLKGATFADFEDLVETLARAALPVALAERAARAAVDQDNPEALALAGQLKEALWDGQVEEVIVTLRRHAEQLGPPQASDGPQHPRRVLANNVGYFQAHARHMDYPTYRRKGWPIGSGVAESGVKQFNKRVKGTEQFWSLPGVKSILSLRALWLSQDDRWQRYWNTRPAHSKAA